MKKDARYPIFQIPVHTIQPNPNQPRRIFDLKLLNELAESIDRHGLLQPITIRQISTNAYELVAGERRLKAIKSLGLETIPAIISNISEKDSSLLALIENLQREDLSFMEEAEGYQHLMNLYNLKQVTLAQQLGKSQSAIANKLRLLQLSASIRKILLSSTLSERHARALLKLSDEASQKKIIGKIIKNNWTVSQTEKYIQQFLVKKEPIQQASSIKGYMKDIRIFTNTIKQAVSMAQETGVEAEYEIRQTEASYEIFITIPIEND